jgi:hypothetical protein
MKRTENDSHKKIDDRLIRKGASHENPTVLQGLPATRRNTASRRWTGNH